MSVSILDDKKLALVIGGAVKAAAEVELLQEFRNFGEEVSFYAHEKKGLDLPLPFGQLVSFAAHHKNGDDDGGAVKRQLADDGGALGRQRDVVVVGRLVGVK